MAINSNEGLNNDEESETEGEVDLEAQLVSALKDLKKARKENRVLKEQAQGFEQVIVDLNIKLEEAKRNKDSLTEQLMANMKEKENREAKIVSLKTKLQTKNIDKSYENNSKILEQIIRNQNPFFDKTDIGYKKNIDEASSSMMSSK